MFKKINSTTLLIVLLVLGAIVAFNKFYLSKKSESTFNDEFVQIDTGRVSTILIYPRAENGKEVKITRDLKGWQLQNKEMKTSANEQMVHNLLQSFADLKSQALAGSDKSSWKQFQVDDSSGSRIKILTSDNKTYDMVIGKFAYNQATRGGLSYVRRNNETPVYAVNGYLSFLVNRPFNSWRDATLIHGNKDNWNKLTFVYADNNGFVLQKQGSTWTMNGTPVDSTKVTQYLNTISNVQNNNFTEPSNSSTQPVYSLTIEGSNQSQPITVTAYPADSTQKFILHSSLNNDGWFSDANTHTVERVFVGQSKFLQ